MASRGLFETRTVAVVGASPGHYFSDRLGENLERGDFSLRTLFVHPRRKRIWGRKVYASLASLPTRPDTVLFLVQGREVLQGVKKMASLGIRQAIVLGSLDGRTGRSVAAAARRGHIALVGPESLGWMDVVAGRLLYCGRLTEVPPAGNVSVVSESGGLFNECLRVLARDGRWGLRRTVCVGRQLCVDAAQATQDLARDDETRVLVVCLQNHAPTAASLVPALHEARARGRHVVLFGTSPRAMRDPRALCEPASPHVIASNVLEGLARTTGAFLASDMDELAEAAAFLSHAPSSRPVHRRVVILSISDGVGQWMEAEALDRGLEMAPLSRAMARDVGKMLGSGRTPANPLDLGAAAVTDPRVLARVVQALTSARRLGAVVVGMHPPDGSSYSDRRNATWLEALQRAGTARGPVIQPVQVSRSAAPPSTGMLRGIRDAMKLLDFWLGHTGSQDSDEQDDEQRAREVQEALRILHGPARTLSEPASRSVLATHDLPFDPWHVVETASQASRKARSMDAPACLKIATPDIPSKQAAGCVRTSLHGPAAVREAYMEVLDAARQRHPDARILGALVTMHRDTSTSLFATTVSLGAGLPALLVCGLGGPRMGRPSTYLCALTPVAGHVGETMATELVEMNGHAGDAASLADLLGNLSRFAHGLASEVACVQVDTIVPVPGGWRCLDARVRVARDVDGRG